jgi:hypothetical protein
VVAKVMSGAARGGWRRNRRPLRLTRSPPSIGRFAALGIATVVLAASAAGAFAYWTGTGSATATTVVPNTQPITFSPGVPTGQLYPGGTASVAIVAHNPNPFFLQIPSLVIDTDDGPPFAADAAHSTCDVSVLSYVAQNNGGAGWSVPPQVGSTDGTLEIDMSSAMHMTVDAANACQGATFTVRLVAPS